MGFSGAVTGLSAHFTAGSSHLMHWRSVRPETNGTNRFPHFGQLVGRSMRSSRFLLNRKLKLLFQSGASIASCSPSAQRLGVLLRSLHPAVSAFPERVVGSACASSFSRLARRSLALRPAHSRRHQFVTRYPKASATSLPP